MDEDATWYKVDVRGGYILLDGFPALCESGTAPPLLGPCLLWPRSPISATAELLYKLSPKSLLKCGVWYSCAAVNNNLPDRSSRGLCAIDEFVLNFGTPTLFLEREKIRLTTASLRETISAASGPKFTTLWGHVEEILLLNKFFSDCRCMPYLRRYSPTKLCDGAQMAIFGDFFGSCICSEPHAAHFRPVFYIRTRATPCVEVW